MVLTLTRQFVTLTGTGKAVRVFLTARFCNIEIAVEADGLCVHLLQIISRHRVYREQRLEPWIPSQLILTRFVSFVCVEYVKITTERPTNVGYMNRNMLLRFLNVIQGAAKRSPLFGKLINSKPKKIRQMFFYFWKVHRMPFYINVFWTKSLKWRPWILIHWCSLYR